MRMTFTPCDASARNSRSAVPRTPVRAASPQREQGHVAHRADALGQPIAVGRLARDERAGRRGIEAVLDHDRDRFGDGRPDRARVQHLRAEARHLQRLFVRHLRQHERRRDGFGIRAQHAVDVGPDLDHRRAKRRADDGGRVVGSIPADRRRPAVFGAADESGDDRDASPAIRRQNDESTRAPRDWSSGRSRWRG